MTTFAEKQKKQMNKIRYRLVYNRSNKLNDEQKALIQIELLLNKRKLYITTGIHVTPHQWDNKTRTIINHPNETGLNAMMYTEITRIETIEIELWKRGITPTLNTIKQHLKSENPITSPIETFQSYINQSDRSKGSKQSMTNTVKTIRKHFGSISWGDITYSFLKQLESKLKQDKISPSTQAKHMEHLRTMVNEAVRNGMIKTDDNPFVRYKIRHEKPTHRYLTPEELRRVEKEAEKRNSTIIDAFLFCCYTGLRYSDMTTLRNDNIVKQGKTTWLIKRTIKTGTEVKIPLSMLFGGKAISIMNKHGGIEPLTRLPCNSSTNKALKQYMDEIGITKRVTFHTARHTCATCLVHYGVPITTVQHILGHTKISTTQHYSEILPTTILQDLKRCKFPK